MSKSLIVIDYVDNILIYGQHDAGIDNLNERLKNKDIAFHCKGTAEYYLGVNVYREGNQKTLKQEGLTKCIIEALGLDSKYSTPVDTPAKSGLLKEVLMEKKQVAALIMPMLLSCFCISAVADPTYLLQSISVQDTTILQSSHT
jgi:hypothetical protein